MAVQPKGCTLAAYRRRSLADTPLYRAVENHLETFLALCHDDWEDERIAPHAERELRSFLKCRIHAQGLARAWCEESRNGYVVPTKSNVRCLKNAASCREHLDRLLLAGQGLS